ncbi:MAG TPA: VanZ family protein [Candidatus Saccharicenans sp.]|jgi:VanZ family protein|nr:VanZ family protein [Candidatus Saccharicenans sp.]HRD01131.1 VanZ family protein [Candidatus Saccharicenans sp.]
MGSWRRLIYFLPAALYCTLIFFLSARSLKIKLGFIYWDKAAHWIEFTVLGLFLAFAFYHYLTHQTFLAFYLSLMTGLFIGLSDEIHQLFVRSRQCDWKDWLADAAGILTGWLLFQLISGPKKKAKEVVKSS